jgi:zinc transporter ZupT
MTTWEYVLLFFSVLAGGGIALYIRENKPRSLRLLLSFSGAYILGIAALHLLPSIFSHGESSIGLWLLVGFFIQILMEQLSRGVEHGHIHAHHHASAGFGIQILIGLCLHSFIEGMPLSYYPHLHGDAGSAGGEVNHLLYGIVLHKAPAAFALVILLMQSGFSRLFILTGLVFFSFMSPLGAFLGEMWMVGELATNRILAIVVGSFLHISTTILFEADDTHEHVISWRKLLAIIAGFSIALLTIL